MKKNNIGRLTTVLAGSVLMIVVALTGCSNPEVDVVIPRAKLQEKVAPKFPLQKKVLVADVTLHSPNVYLAGDKVGLKVEIDAVFLKFPLKGSVDVQCGLRYVPETAQFFVTEINIVDVTVNNAKMINTDQLMKIVAPLVSDALQTTPVYTLPDNSLKEQLVGKFLKRVTVRDSTLIATFGKK